MIDIINKIKDDFWTLLQESNSPDKIDSLRVKYLGKKGDLTSLLKQLASLSIEEKKSTGALINQLKDDITLKLEEKFKYIEDQAFKTQLLNEKIDFTLPANKIKKGKLHPITLVNNEIQAIFQELGFIIAEGPEVENDYYNFSALNFPADHPARDMHDTFYLDYHEPRLLRTHTSGTQIHVLEQFKPPVRVIMPGKVFRSDADISHSPVFHQVEGLYVDKNVSFSHLKAVLQYFLESFFYKGASIRMRPSFFPFTEPSVEVDVACVICKGKGCSMCKQSGWIEILGAGLVDPNVLKNVNIDPDIYSGFAFGVGVERLAILKYGINNIKLFYDNHNFFLEQF